MNIDFFLTYVIRYFLTTKTFSIFDAFINHACTLSTKIDFILEFMTYL